jgi:peptidoglycan DL-endopeptidase CwlO
MRLRLLMPLLGLAFGCASGSPMGSRALSREARHIHFSPAAFPRRPILAQVAQPSLPGIGALGLRGKAVSLAQQLVGRRSIRFSGRSYPGDCTGLLLGIYRQLGLDLMGSAERGDNGVTAIYRYAQEHGRVYQGGWPVEGDLIFFRNTYDQNRDGRTNDGLTHIGLVERTLADGTVWVIHRVDRGVVRYRMNLNHPTLHRHPRTGEPLNDYLRAPGQNAKPLLTGQLFAAYATVLPIDPRPSHR